MNKTTKRRELNKYERFLIRDFKKYLERQLIKKSSIEQYCFQAKLLLRLCDNVSSKEDIGKEEIINFLIYNRYKFRQDEHRTYIRKTVTNKFLKFIGKRELLEDEDIKPLLKRIEVHVRRHERKLELPEYKKLIEYLENEDKKLATALFLLWDTGLRIAPILKLKKQDIKKDINGYYIRTIEKGGIVAKRYLEKFTKNKLDELSDIDGRYFMEKVSNKNDEGKTEWRWETTREAYYRMWSKLQNLSRKFFKQEKHGISFHWARTSRAIQLFEKYKNIMQVKNFLGHRNINTTMRYIDEAAQTSADIIKNEEGKWEK